MEPLKKIEVKNWSYADLIVAKKSVYKLSKNIKYTIEDIEDSMQLFEPYDKEYIVLKDQLQTNRHLYLFLIMDMKTIEKELVSREDAIVVRKRKGNIKIYYSLN